jgi:CubicO group peptidase (beta-lactamase class C family)
LTGGDEKSIHGNESAGRFEEAFVPAKRTLSMAIVVLGVSTTFAQAPVPSTRADARIVEALGPIRLECRVPALAGAIVTSKGLEAAGAVGVRKAGTDVAVTIDDQWHLGSDTKAMTAALIGALVEKGTLTWETTIGQALPDLAPEFATETRDLTLLHLLSHRAGLPANISWFPFIRSDKPLRDQRLEVVNGLAGIKLVSRPGSAYLYSNLGFVVAGAMVEAATSSSWEDSIRKHVFEPLGMPGAGFGGMGTPGELDQPWGHTPNGKPVAGNGPAMDNPAVMGPAGTVHASLADWAKFVADQLRGARGEKALLRPGTYAKLHTPPFGGEYALGWLVVEREWGGGTVLTHAGSNTMNYAVVWIAPKRGFAVLAVTNQGGGAAQKACDEAAGALIKIHAAGPGR